MRRRAISRCFFPRTSESRAACSSAPMALLGEPTTRNQVPRRFTWRSRILQSRALNPPSHAAKWPRPKGSRRGFLQKSKSRVYEWKEGDFDLDSSQSEKKNSCAQSDELLG
jgi:hypothetical protein